MLISRILARIQSDFCGVCLYRDRRVTLSRSYKGDVDTFGVALMETRPGSRHAGLIVDMPELGGKRFLHLAWHYMFLNDSIPQGCQTYGNDSFTKDEQDYLAERLLRRWKRNGNKVAYGLDYDGTPAFDSHDDFDGSEGRGLTCATFVLDFLSSCAFHICEVETWKFRPEDEKFQQFIFEQLSNRLCIVEDAEQLARVKKSVGHAARFRPEEVVACFARFEDELIPMPPAQFWGYEVLHESKMLVI